jgi:hypothetical protein
VGEDRGSKEMDGCPLTGGATLLSMFRVLIMLNNWLMSSFVARVASACSLSLTSRFWSRLVSIVVEVIDFRECGEVEQGVVGATDFL